MVLWSDVKPCGVSWGFSALFSLPHVIVNYCLMKRKIMFMDRLLLVDGSEKLAKSNSGGTRWVKECGGVDVGGFYLTGWQSKLFM